MNLLSQISNLKLKRRVWFGVALLAAIIILQTIHPSDTQAWGRAGHELSGRVAAMKLPPEMPKFFRKEVELLSYLNPEPDRWRARAESNLDKAQDSAAAADHFIDLELAPEAAFSAINRYDFVAELLKAGKQPTRVGFAPYRMLELFQRLRLEFRLWRAEPDGRKRRWIEQRILNDAGILGHYVSDVANPHHTTIHFNGWSGDNPKGYTVYTNEPNKGFHYRFEELYVQTHLKLNDVLPLIANQPRVIEKPREELWAHIRNSNKLVEQLYILDKQEAFNETTTSAEHKKFASERLAAGVQMLRDLWWTAWVTSDPKLTPAPPPRPATGN